MSKTNFICCFIVTTKNLIWLVVFSFFCSWWLAGQYLFAVLEWHLFATSHGKSPCDGIGGTVKSSLARASLQNTSILNKWNLWMVSKSHWWYKIFQSYWKWCWKTYWYIWFRKQIFSKVRWLISSFLYTKRWCIRNAWSVFRWLLHWN